MKQIKEEADIYSRSIENDIPGCNRKLIYNAYIDGYENAIDIELIDDIIDYYKNYCAGVENGKIDEYEISSVTYILNKLKHKK